jgi:DNA-directed RNA polymerase specialized sigma24 family protein
MMAVMSDVTQLLAAIEQGDQRAADELLPLVYEELRRLARARMASERAGHTLSATALVHEAYLRDDVVALDESLRRLEEHDSAAASVVKLRYFAGMSMPETAEALGIPLRTAERNWTYARTWLRRDMA